MNTELIVSCACVAALLAAMIWTILLRERARTRKVKALAPALGFSMVNANGIAALNEFSFRTPLFDRGERGSNRISNAMQGSVCGLRAILFDLRYYVDSGGTVETAGRSTHRRTVAAFSVPQHDLPTFCIKKNGLWSRHDSNRVPIEGSPKFSDRFVVTGSDRAALQKLLGPSLTRSLLATQLPEKLVIEGAGPWLLFYYSNKRLRPERWKEFLEVTSNVAGQFLSHQASNVATLSA